MRSPLERAVREVHAQLTEMHHEFCSCEQCADDVVAMVMNQIRPRYTTTGLGWAVETADLDTDQVRAQLSVLVFEAMHRVAEQPRHAPSEAVTRKPKPSGA
ncbi:MAG TPA: late competence development ComFB family protein [Gemmatimonadaceae bacterium]|jgi:competence protein ComFB